MAEMPSQFCYSFVSQDSEKVLGRNRDSVEAMFLSLPAEVKTWNGVDLCKYTESKQSRKRRGLFKLKNSHGTRKEQGMK